MPYVTELCLFSAAFIAAYSYGKPALRWLDRLRRQLFRRG